MGLFAEVFLGFIRKNPKGKTDKKSDYVFYKIVDFSEEGDYLLQCINTNAIFRANISNIVFDIDILHSLHPIQACYIGIEYAKYLKKNGPPAECQSQNDPKINNYSICRYGNYYLCYQNRKGDLCFIHKSSNEEFIMDPRDIALSESLISEFDAAQAFYIGLTAGLKMNNPTENLKIPKNMRPHLRIVE